MAKKRPNGCGKDFAVGGSNYGTSTLAHHISKCGARQKYHSDQAENLKSSQINYKRVRYLISMAIIEHDLPYSFVEYKWIRELFKLLNPDVKHISEKVAIYDVWKIYLEQKENLKQVLSKSHGRICLTSDCWTSITSEGYVCLTAHFVDDNWKLNRKILSFCKIEHPYTGVELAGKVYDCLKDWGIDKKLFSITLDNASATDNMQYILKEQLSLQNSLVCNGEFFCVRCCAHILNLIIQEGLKVIDCALQNIRESIKYVKSSEARMINFKQCVEQVGGIDTSMGLRLDIPTRWNSTYAMLKSGIEYRCAFALLALDDSDYKYCPPKEDWKRVEEICHFLNPFKLITNLISGSSYPTSNMYFLQISRIERLLTENTKNDDLIIQDMAQRMKEKFDKYWSDCSVIFALGTILDPRLKFDLIRYAYSWLDPMTCLAKIEDIKSKLYFIYDQYSIDASSSYFGGSSSNFSTTDAQQSTLGGQNAMEKKMDESEIFLEVFGDYINFVNQDITLVRKSELDFYLEETILDPHLYRGLDILTYWKSRELQFPRLSRMACDILSIPITTVDSESTFSTSLCILTKYRCSLLSDDVQARICARNWLYGFEYNDGDDDEESTSKIDILSMQDSNIVIDDE